MRNRGDEGPLASSVTGYSSHHSAGDRAGEKRPRGAGAGRVRAAAAGTFVERRAVGPADAFALPEGVAGGRRRWRRRRWLRLGRAVEEGAGSGGADAAVLPARARVLMNGRAIVVARALLGAEAGAGRPEHRTGGRDPPASGEDRIGADAHR